MADREASAKKIISSPNELQSSAFVRIRGQIISNGRLGKKAGIVAIAVLVVLVGLILYGVSLNKPHIAMLQQYTKPLPPPDTTPWWQNQSDAARASLSGSAAPRSRLNVPPRTPNVSQSGSTPPAQPSTVVQHVPGALSGPDIVGRNVKIPTIPLLEEQSSNASLTQPDVRTVPGIKTQKESLLRAAMLSSSLIDQRSPTSIGGSPFTLKAGAVIPAALITSIDSDLPGLLVAQVRQNVYDTVTGRALLVPQGAKIVGAYDSRISYGQGRLLVTWTRLIYPDGVSVDLKDMAGADLAGRAGFDAHVQNHTSKLFRGVLLLSIIGAGAQLSQPQQLTINGSAPGAGQILAGSVGNQIANASTQITQRQLSVSPNLRVAAGYQFNVLVDRDLVFPAAYR